jgi:uncharacterized protein (TIGR01777 family)
MKTVLIAGGTGLIGRKLTSVLKERGFKVYKLSRKNTRRRGYITWNPELQTADSKNFHKINILVNLVGSNIADKRWSTARKQELIQSRVNTTLFLRKLAGQIPNLEYYISASGINCYGPESAHVHTEEDPLGGDFLSQLVKEWEAASDTFSDIVPVTKLRIAMVLSKEGGALRKMKLPFKFGFGAALGTGKQNMPWIHLDDLCRMFVFSIENNLEGVFNAFSACTSNIDFSRALAKAVKRPFIMPNVPSKFLRFFLGERASILLDGIKVSNDKIVSKGFTFQHKTIGSTLKHLMK